MINLSSHVDLRQAINNLDVLPTMPIIAQKLLALDLDTEEGIRQLMVIIDEDPPISARILGLANSAMIGASRNIMTLKDATMMLGINRVKSIACGIAIISQMQKGYDGKLNLLNLWQHSIGNSFALLGIAHFMPENIRPKEDQIFLVGMLHDIGYLVLAFLDPKLSDKLHNRLAAEAGRSSLEVELEILDIGHDELGAALARHWNMPEEFVAALRYHHYPDAADAVLGQPLVRMINIAEKLLPSFGLNDYVEPSISTEEWESLGINPSNAVEVKVYLEEVANQTIQISTS